MEVSNFVFPVKLAGNNAVTESSIALFFEHTEKKYRTGYFPLGANMLWHGGLHLHVPERTEIFSIADGEVVATRISEDADKTYGEFGSHNFILTKHAIRGATLNRQFPDRVGSADRRNHFSPDEVKYFYCLYMHLHNDVIDEKTNAKEKQFPWLTRASNFMAALKAGDVVKITDVKVKVGELLWTSGKGPNRIGIIHWEIFSEENLLRSFPIIEDTIDDYNVDSPKIVEMVKRAKASSKSKANSGDDDIANLYLNASGHELGFHSYRFASEWGMDVDNAIKKMAGKFSTRGLKNKLLPYIWWPKVFPKEFGSRVWHYNPIMFVNMFSAKYSVCIELVEPTQMPFAKYRLEPATEVEYHLDFTGKENGKEKIFSASGSFSFHKKRHRIALTETQFDSLKSVVIWGKAYGTAAFVDPGANRRERDWREKADYYVKFAKDLEDPDADVAMGRLQIARNRAKDTLFQRDGTHRELVFSAVAITSVVDFIVREASINKGAPVLQEIHSLIQDDHMLRAKYKWSHKVHKNEGVAGLGQDGVFGGGGEWDYKPVIREVWGAKQRLGNSEYLFYYDMWANFHYGFIGRIAGFPKDILISGANEFQFIDALLQDAYDPVDDVLTQVGYDLSAFTRDAVLGEIDVNKDDFKTNSRERYWKDQRAAKAYVVREFAKRSIPDPKDQWKDE